MLFKEIFITRNLLRAIFSFNDVKLRSDEIVHKTDNTLIIYLASASRCCEVSCVDNILLTEHITQDKKYKMYSIYLKALDREGLPSTIYWMRTIFICIVAP